MVDVAAWSWVFLIDLSLAGAAAVIALRHVPESRDPGASRRGRFDAGGADAVTVDLGGAVYALTEGPAQGWPAPTVVAARSALPQ